jgi:steroid delta-isomerase-like uncharacterized protein
MPTPHPTDEGFTKAYARAWTADPEGLLEFFAADGSYTDVAMGVTYECHEGISRFHRFMLAFAADSVIDFTTAAAHDGQLFCEWTWSGTFSGPLRLRTGHLVDATGSQFEVPGIAACTYDRDGRLTSHRDFWDLGTVLAQAGVPVDQCRGGGR